MADVRVRYSLSAFEMMMLWFAVVGNITAIQRAWGTWKELKGK